MKRNLFCLLLAVAVAGCSSLVPKRVEFFQDRVEKFPEQPTKLVELERQAIYRAHESAKETVVAAVAENASTNVVTPAKATEQLTEAVAVALGPPVSPASKTEPAERLAVKLETAVAKFERKVEDFKKDSDENVGKKIEGTGIIQVGYFYWVGGIVLALVVLFTLGKLALTVAATMNPGAAIGLNVLKGAGAIAAKGFAQVIKGGEEFKKWVGKEISDLGLRDKILNEFQSHQMKAQDEDVQNVVQVLTK